jgi:hypothetical protein
MLITTLSEGLIPMVEAFGRSSRTGLKGMDGKLIKRLRRRKRNGNVWWPTSGDNG